MSKNSKKKSNKYIENNNKKYLPLFARCAIICDEEYIFVD